MHQLPSSTLPRHHNNVCVGVNSSHLFRECAAGTVEQLRKKACQALSHPDPKADKFTHQLQYRAFPQPKQLYEPRIGDAFTGHKSISRKGITQFQLGRVDHIETRSNFDGKHQPGIRPVLPICGEQSLVSENTPFNQRLSVIRVLTGMGISTP